MQHPSQDQPRDLDGRFGSKRASAPGPFTTPWPTVVQEDAYWISDDGRTEGEHRQAVVPYIADSDLDLPADTTSLAAEATEQLHAFDEGMSGSRLRFAAPILLRTEAASSSQIEQLSASSRSILAAELGSTDRENATVIARNGAAMSQAVASAGGISRETILGIHRTLMAHDERHTPGHFRQEPVWIGAGSTSTPLNAKYVAPDFESVPELMDDLSVYAGRMTPENVVATSAVMHAQFVTVHPFTDGNGRTGRTLIHVALHRAGATSSAVVPLSAGVLTDLERYESAITEYQDGDPEPIVRVLAGSIISAIPRAEALASSIAERRESWSDKTGVAQGSIPDRLLDLVAVRPVVDVGLVMAELDLDTQQAREALDELDGLGILTAHLPRYHGISTWRNTEVLEILDQFAKDSERR